MRHQRAIVALRQIELTAHVTVVDEQRQPLAQRTGDGVHPVRQLRQNLGAIALHEVRSQRSLEVMHRAADQCIRRKIHPLQPTIGSQ